MMARTFGRELGREELCSDEMDKGAGGVGLGKVKMRIKS
jgi:hypothetical protein